MQVVAPAERGDDAALVEAFISHSPDERLVNSGRFSDMTAPHGAREIVKSLESDGKARFTVTYRIRDWLISRQRYWGTPIPVIYCVATASCPCRPTSCRCCSPSTVDYRAAA